MGNSINLRGQTFDRLFVLEDVGRSPAGNVLWLCKCSCGNMKIVNAQCLKRGNTKSCGCMSKENSAQNGKRNARDLIGQIFGDLVVTERSGSKRNRALWKCLCICGNITYVVSGSLISGNTISCGCHKSNILVKRNTKHGLCRTSAYRDIKRLVSGILDTAWSRKMEQELRKLQPVCVVCGNNKKMSTDHVYPLSKGFGLRVGNAVRLCGHCNAVKYNKLPEELSVGMREKILLAAKQFQDYWADAHINDRWEKK